MTTVVLDSSAIIAFFQGEQGAEQVEAQFARSVISSVNWSEVVQKSLAFGLETTGLLEEATALGLRIVPFDVKLADIAAQLWPHTRAHGLSLGDRACLALARELAAPVLTADRAWKNVRVGVTVTLIR